MTAQRPRPMFPHSSRTLLLAAALLSISPCASRADVTIVTPSESDRNATNLHLSYRADRMLARDLAHIELRFEVSGDDPGAVEAELNHRMAAALDQAKQLEGTAVEIGAFAVVRQTAASLPHAVPSVAVQAGMDANAAVLAAAGEWKAAQLLSLAGRNLRGLAGLTTRLQKDGAIVSDMRFDLSPETLAAVRKELAGEALSKLRAQAEQMASDMGMQIERYHNIDVATPNPEATQARSLGVQQATAAGLTVLQAGEMNVGVVVNATVSLARKANP